MIKRKSLKAWVAKKGRGGKFVDKKIIESTGCQRRGNFDKKKIIESMGCHEGRGKSLKAWVAEKGGGKIAKKKIIESIGSMGCQERGGGGNF